MRKPSDLLADQAGGTSTAAAGNFQNTTIIPNPGNNLRIRVWACHATLLESQTAMRRGYYTPLGGVAADAFGSFGVSSNLPADHAYWDGGFPLPENTGLQARWTANAAAGQEMQWSVVYTLERVA